MLFDIIHHSTVINLISCCFFWSSKTRKTIRKKLQSQVNESYLIKVHEKKIARLRSKEKIDILFFVFDDALWPYDDVYTCFKNNDRFDTKILIIPNQKIPEKERLDKMEIIHRNFVNNGYSVESSFNQGEYIKVENADLIFYTSPYEISLPQYSIEHWKHRALTCYVPYGILQANLQQLQYNKRFHNLLWRYFCETEMHKLMSEKYSNNKGARTFVTGYPKADRLICKSHVPKNPWLNKNKDAAKVIWAPHHTIDNGIDFSCFLLYAETIKNTIEELGDRIQLAFKPHPNLRAKLYSHNEWGRKKTDEYFKFWETSPNTQIEEGEYIDLFLTSDAMIFDSVSFIAEYSLLEKQMLFTLKTNDVGEKFNEFGQAVFKQIPKARTNQDVQLFLENPFDKKYSTQIKKASAISQLLYKGNMKSSERIYDHIVKELSK